MVIVLVSRSPQRSKLLGRSSIFIGRIVSMNGLGSTVGPSTTGVKMERADKLLAA
jgi:hypothetical protein